MEIEFLTQNDPTEKRLQLLQSVCFGIAGALAGALILFLTGGWPFWPAVCFGAILWIHECFKPYRQMRKEAKIRLEEKGLVYCEKEKEILYIPFACIEAIKYRDGLAIQLKNPLTEKIRVCDANLRLSKFFRASSQKRAEFFFSGFDISIQTRLNDIVHANQPRQTALRNDR